MKANIVYNANDHQKAFHDDLTTKFLHLSGGFGSGKTFALCQKILLLSFLNRPFAGGLVCPTFTDYHRDVLPTMEDILHDSRIKYDHHKSRHVFTMPWHSKIYVVTADKKIRGPNWAYAGINEATLIPLMRYREVISRVRIKGSPFPQIASSGTPEGLGSEYYDIFVDKPWDRSKIIYGDTRANAHNLADDFIQTLQGSFDPMMLEAYMKGLFVNMLGNRFYYSYDSFKQEDRMIVEDRSQAVHISLDFNVDPMVATCWHYTGWQIQGFDEIVISGTDTTNLMCKAMKARGYTPDRTIIYPDPSGQQRSTKGLPDIEILKKNGYDQIIHKSIAPTFRQRQLNVNNLLDKRVIRFNPDKCPTLKKDLVGVEQNKVTLEKVKTNPRLTHSSDGLDYLCDNLFPFSGKRPESRIVTFR